MVLKTYYYEWLPDEVPGQTVYWDKDGNKFVRQSQFFRDPSVLQLKAVNNQVQLKGLHGNDEDREFGFLLNWLFDTLFLILWSDNTQIPEKAVRYNGEQKGLTHMAL